MSEYRDVILAYVYPRNERTQAQSLIEETILLCEACGFHVCEVITQEKDYLDSKTGFYKGKVEELKTLVEYHDVKTVVFCNELPISIGLRLSQILDVEVMDRNSLILHIFSMRAQTKQAKLQVELARLQYALPRQMEPEDIQSHERGGSFSNRGAGEMRSTRIKKRYQARITQLKKQLKAIEKENQSAETRRQKSALGRVGIIGYTNAGKSSFMNAVLEITGEKNKDVQEKDMLFATLDTYVRHITYQSKEFLLYDTVGFVSNLPHELIEAFQTTLQSTLDADLLIHVIDASSANMEEKIEVTENTLKQIKADHIPCIRVYNKMDIAHDFNHENGISCKTKEGIENILQQIIHTLYPEETTFLCHIPYDKMSLIAEGKKTLSMKTIEENETGIKMEIKGPMVRMIPFLPYRL